MIAASPISFVFLRDDAVAAGRTAVTATDHEEYLEPPASPVDQRSSEYEIFHPN